MWPKRRPERSPGEEEKRCKREESVGPEICIRCSGRSSIERERERNAILLSV